MSDKLKPYLTWATYFLLLFAVWTIKYQPRTIVLPLVLGVAGTFLIFVTEVGYTYRKLGIIQLGSVRIWLRTHILIGILGPAIIIWHTGLNFYGFAGWLAGLTVVVVISGFIGRYIYRLIPRTSKGQALSLQDMEAESATLATRLQVLLQASPEAARLVGALRDYLGAPDRIDLAKDSHTELIHLFRSSIKWEVDRIRLRRFMAGRGSDDKKLLRELRDLELEQLALRRRMNLRDAARAAMSTWDLLHKPMTVALFVGILIHIYAVLNYGRALP